MIMLKNTVSRATLVLITISLSSCGLFKPKKIEVEEIQTPPVVEKPKKPSPNQDATRQRLSGIYR